MNTLFDKPGYKNTETTLKILKRGIDKYAVNQVVIASTWGDTGLAVAKMLKDSTIKVVVITHNFGFKEPGTHEMSQEMRNNIASHGATVYTGTMPFRNIGTAIREKQGYSQQDLVANVLRIFGQGIKVCIEITMMASDSGLIAPDDVLAVAGTARGADTVALIKPASSNKMFDLKVKDILAKPINF